MRIEIGWIICLLMCGATVGHSADLATSAHLPCEQLHKARHYLSVGDFARCVDELRSVRQACTHRECLEQADLLQRDCESMAMMALLKSPSPTSAETISTQMEVGLPTSQMTKAESGFKLPATSGREPTVGDAAVGGTEADAPAQLAGRPFTASAVAVAASAELTLPAATARSSGDMSQAPPIVQQDVELPRQNMFRWSGFVPLLQSWSVTLLLLGIFCLQIMMWTRRWTSSGKANSPGAAAGNSQGEPSREADVFAQIMLKNVHLRELRGDSNQQRTAKTDESRLASPVTNTRRSLAVQAPGQGIPVRVRQVRIE